MRKELKKELRAIRGSVGNGVSFFLFHDLFDRIVDHDHEDQKNECGDAVKNGVLLKEARRKADRNRQQDRKRAEDLVLEELALADEYAVEKNERVIDMDAREDVGRCVDLVKIPHHRAAKIFSGYGLGTKEKLRRKECRDNDEKAHADHEKTADADIGILVCEKRPQADKRDPGEPHHVRDDESRNKGDLVVDRHFRHIIRTRLDPFDEEEKDHVDHKKDQHGCNDAELPSKVRFF